MTATATHRPRTYTPKLKDVERQWWVVDVEGLVLGRAATEVARLLRGKHKPMFAPHLDTGDHVIIVNASRVVLTSGKRQTKLVRSHSGYPGGLKATTYGELLESRPEEAIRRTVAGMLPKNRLGRQMLKKLRVYAGPDHPHDAQKPVVREIPAASATRHNATSRAAGSGQTAGTVDRPTGRDTSAVGSNHNDVIRDGDRKAMTATDSLQKMVALIRPDLTDDEIRTVADIVAAPAEEAAQTRRSSKARVARTRAQVAAALAKKKS